MIKKTIFPFLVFSSLFFGGCSQVDLTSVKQLSEQGIKTTDNYPDVMKDLFDSCIRASEYQEGARKIPVISPPSATIINNQSTEQAKGSAFLQSCNQSKIIKISEENAKNANGISRAIWLNDVLQEYFLAIGQLAGLNVNLGKSANNLAEAVAGLLESSTTPQQQAEIKAGGQILGFIFNIVADKIRDDRLKSEITARNQDVAIVIDALADTIKSYKAKLFLEEEQINNFYGGALESYESLRTRNSPLRNSQEDDETLPLFKVLIDTEWNKSRAIIREKGEIADDFIKALEQLKEAHDDISKTLARISDDNHLTRAEINQLNQVMSQHSQNLEPSLKKLEKDLQKLKK